MIQIRTEGDRREIDGRLVAWGETIHAEGQRERFAAGAFADAVTNPAGVRLYVEHPNLPGRSAGPQAVGRPVPVGAATALEERDDGLYGTFRVARTPAGDEALELVRSGVLTDLSIGFAARRSRLVGNVREYTAGLLDHVALVAHGAFRSAQVLATRSEDLDPDPSEPVEEPMTAPDPTPTTPDPTPDEPDDSPATEELRNRMQTLEDGLRVIAAAAAPAPAPAAPLDPIAWFRGEVLALHHRDASHRLSLRALSDVTGDFPATLAPDLSPFVVEEFLSSQLVNVLDVRRPVFAHGGSFTMPRSGYARIPQITQHTKVALRTGQKDPANTQAMQASVISYEAQWFDGAVDVALEWLATAEGPALELVWRDLLGQYAIATGDAAGAALETSGTATGAVLPVATYKEFAKAVATQAIEVRKATGAPATALAIPEALWPDVVAMVDASDRRQFATSGPSNADGSVALNAESFTMPTGIDVFLAPGLTSAVLFNGDAFLTADGGPSRVEAVNVELMGRDIGILGRAMIIPRIPPGIRVFKAAAGGSQAAKS